MHSAELANAQTSSNGQEVSSELTGRFNSVPAKDEGSALHSRSEGDQQEAPAVELDWQQLVDYTRQHFVAIYSVLTKCGHSLSGSTLTIYTGNAFYKKKLDDTKYRVNITKSLIEIGVGELIIETVPVPAPPKDSVAASVAAIMGGGEEVSVGEVAAS